MSPMRAHGQAVPWRGAADGGGVREMRMRRRTLKLARRESESPRGTVTFPPSLDPSLPWQSDLGRRALTARPYLLICCLELGGELRDLFTLVNKFYDVKIYNFNKKKIIINRIFDVREGGTSSSISCV